MQRGLLYTGALLALAGGFWYVGEARAVIIRLTPLADVLEPRRGSSRPRWIRSTRVGRPCCSWWTRRSRARKGRKTARAAEGDKGAVKRKESAQLLERLADKLQVVVFLRESKEDLTAFVYSNELWCSLSGPGWTARCAGRSRTWSLTCGETYAGTTAEMVQTVRDALAGKRKAPAVSEKGKAWPGPKVAPTKKTGYLQAPMRRRAR